MTAGTVTISSTGGETKSGMAEAVYDAMKSEVEAVYGTIPSGSEGVTAKESIALMARALATAHVTYMQANAKARATVNVFTDSASDTSPATQTDLAIV